MKSLRPPTIFALPLLTLSLVFLSSAGVYAASIVRSKEGLNLRLPEPKGLKGGAATVKRSALSKWITFEAPFVSRRGTLTLSNGTLQLKGGSLNLAGSNVSGLFSEAATTLESVNFAGGGTFDLGSADEGIFNLAWANGIQLVAGSLNLPSPDGSVVTVASNLESPVTNGISTAASGGSEGAVVNQGPVPVPEPTGIALLALSAVGLLIRRERR